MAVRLLLVDDDAMNVRALVRALRSGSFIIHTATSGVEALSQLAGATVDAVLADYSMPGMDGLQLFAALRRSYPLVTRILVTAHTDLLCIEQAARDGLAQRVVYKPWEPAELYAAIARSPHSQVHLCGETSLKLAM